MIHTVTHLFIYEAENQLYLSVINTTVPSAALLSAVYVPKEKQNMASVSVCCHKNKHTSKNCIPNVKFRHWATYNWSLSNESGLVALDLHTD